MNGLNIIYGLIDPRTRLICYVGQSTSGLTRPRQHGSRSVVRKAKTRCGAWVKQLQDQGLEYEIVILETVRWAVDLNVAECWWIAYGHASGWPLTNSTDGGTAGLRGRHARALREARRRRKELEAGTVWRIGRGSSPVQAKKTTALIHANRRRKLEV